MVSAFTVPLFLQVSVEKIEERFLRSRRNLFIVRGVIESHYGLLRCCAPFWVLPRYSKDYRSVAKSLDEGEEMSKAVAKRHRAPLSFRTRQRGRGDEGVRLGSIWCNKVGELWKQMGRVCVSTMHDILRCDDSSGRLNIPAQAIIF